jgi:hypothetical protein
MLVRSVLVAIVACGLLGSAQIAAAQHERSYEFDDTHVAISIERFMGIEYVDLEGPGGDKATARLFLNASEYVPTSHARLGIDVFIERLSIGLAGGVTSEDTAILAPRIGYLFGLTPKLGLWLRGGAFYATTSGPEYVGITAEVLFQWFPYSFLAFHLGPTLDVAFADDPNPDYVAIGIPELGLSAWF